MIIPQELRVRQHPLTLPPRPRARQRLRRLPRAVVEVGVPRGPGAVEGKGELLVVLVLLTPHPKGLEHLSAQQIARSATQT